MGACSRLSRSSAGYAYQLVLFQIAFGTLHIDVPLGCKLRADLIIRSGTGFEDAVQITNQQHAQQKLRIHRGPTRFAVAVLQLLAHEGKADVLFEEPQQVGFRNLIFQAEVVEQRFRAVVLPQS